MQASVSMLIKVTNKVRMLCTSYPATLHPEACIHVPKRKVSDCCKECLFWHLNKVGLDIQSHSVLVFVIEQSLASSDALSVFPRIFVINRRVAER